MFFDAIAANKAKLALPFGPRPAPSAPLTAPYEFAARARDRFLNVTFVDASPLIADLRLVKTPYEQIGADPEWCHLEQRAQSRHDARHVPASTSTKSRPPSSRSISPMAP